MASKKNVSVSIVPWFNAAQFKKVYEYLYSDDITKKKWAVDTIAVWDTRCHPSLPTAIEATYVLTSAVIQDILWTNQTTLIHHTDLQGIYGSAVTRFVSLSVEVNKKTESPTYSIAEVAKSIGIPSFIVDIRNEWCHSSRPSIAVLRLAARSALNYLKESYWKQEVARVTNHVKQPMDETELYTLFKEFLKFNDLPNSTNPKTIITDDGKKFYSSEYKKLLVQLEKYLKKNKRFFVKVLVSDGIFIPADEDLKLLVSPLTYSLFDTEYYMEDDEEEEEEEDEEMMEDDMSDSSRNENMKEPDEFEEKHLPEVPKYHVELWLPIILLLHKYDSVPLFIEDLLRSQGDRTVVGQKLIIAWLLDILRIHGGALHSVKASDLKKLFRQKGIAPNWLSMLHSAVANPSKYTFVLLPYILGHLEIKMEVACRIIGLASIKLGLISHASKRKSYYKLFHTSNDLKQAMEFQTKKEEPKRIKMMPKSKAKQKMKEQAAESIWSPCPDDCHKLWPVGYIVNAVKDSLEDEKEKEILSWSSINAEMSGRRMRSSNKNEDDDDQTWRMGEEPDLFEIMLEIEGKQTARY